MHKGPNLAILLCISMDRYVSLCRALADSEVDFAIHLGDEGEHERATFRPAQYHSPAETCPRDPYLTPDLLHERRDLDSRLSLPWLELKAGTSSVQQHYNSGFVLPSL